MTRSVNYSRAALICGFALLTTIPLRAQILRRIHHAVKETIEDRAVDQSVDQTNKAIDQVEHAGKTPTQSDDATPEDDHSTAPNNASGSETKGPENKPATEPTIISYKNYDFVPGDTIIFQSHIADDKVGDLPSQFRVTEGQMDIQSMGGENLIHVPPGGGVTFSPRMTSTAYLPDQFTVEFDVENEKFGLAHLKVEFGDEDENIPQIDFSYDVTTWTTGNIEPPEDLHLNYDYPMHWHHIAIAVNKNQGKLYIDQYRLISANNLTGHAKAIIFHVGGFENSFIKNVRIASGGIDIDKTVTTEGRIVMHGILFDVDKATLKPQSMGSINQIFDLLKKNPSLKFEIDGHTDNTGQPAHNLALSQKRAESVKAQLVKMGIDGSRLSTKGFGDTKPIGENDSPEGKANNRRVEFVKI